MLEEGHWRRSLSSLLTYNLKINEYNLAPILLPSDNKTTSDSRAQLQPGFMWGLTVSQGVTGGICVFVSVASLKKYKG